MNVAVLPKVEQVVLPDTGFLRLPEVLKFIPVGKTVWYEGMKTGRFPVGVRLAEKCVAWRAEDIRALIEKLGGVHDSV